LVFASIKLPSLLGRPTLVGKALSFTHELYLFIYQSTQFNSHAVDDHQMYFGGLVVDKVSTIDTEISPTTPLIFAGVSKGAKCGVV